MAAKKQSNTYISYFFSHKRLQNYLDIVYLTRAKIDRKQYKLYFFYGIAMFISKNRCKAEFNSATKNLPKNNCTWKFSKMSKSPLCLN